MKRNTEGVNCSKRASATLTCNLSRPASIHCGAMCLSLSVGARHRLGTTAPDITGWPWYSNHSSLPVSMLNMAENSCPVTMMSPSIRLTSIGGMFLAETKVVCAAFTATCSRATRKPRLAQSVSSLSVNRTSSCQSPLADVLPSGMSISLLWPGAMSRLPRVPPRTFLPSMLSRQAASSQERSVK